MSVERDRAWSRSRQERVEVRRARRVGGWMGERTRERTVDLVPLR